MRITEKDGRALCTYGGAGETKLDASVDYTMSARDRPLGRIGRGAYGPLRAVMFGRLEFQGSIWRSDGQMDSFQQLLPLVRQGAEFDGLVPDQ